MVFKSAGKPPWSTRDMMASELVLANSINLYAASAFLDDDIRAREEPPFSELTFSPAFHVGIWAIRHFPAPSEALFKNMPGAHAADITLANSPEPTERYQSSELSFVFVSISPSSIIFCQKSQNFCTPLSVVSLTVTLVPSLDVEYGCPPACQTIALKNPAFPGSLVIYEPICLIFFASW